jgi:hypothetical protein
VIFVENFILLYAESIDAWILQTSDGFDENGDLQGTILFVAKNLSKQEQEDELLDLILKKDENQEYYEEILRIIAR